MTFATRIAANRKDIVLWVAIQGIKRVFKERAVSVSTAVLGEARDESACLKDVSEGGSEIDYERLAQTGGGLSFKLVQPFGQTFLTDLFQPRKRRQTFLTADLAVGGTTITVSSTSGMTAGDDIYIGQETIRIGTVSTGTTLTGCTREKYGSRQKNYKASSSVLGASVYTVPPVWVGRRVSLYASLLQPDGTTTNGLTTQLGTFQIEENPTWEDGTKALSFRCGPLMDEYSNARAYIGYKEVGAGAISDGGVVDDELEVECDAPQFFKTPDSLFPTFALLTRDGRGTIARVYNYDTVTGVIVIGSQDFMSPPGLRWQANGRLSSTLDPFENARHIALVQGSTGQWALWILASRHGDNVNGAWDVLPGLDRTDLEDPETRMGCGILEDDLDTDAFTALSGSWVTYPLMKETRASEILYECCLALDAFSYVKSDGKLSLQRLGDNTNTPVLTLDTSYTIANERPKVYVDEESIAPVVKWRLNFDPVEDDFDVEHITIDSELLQKFPTREDPKVIESRGLGVDIPQSLADAQKLSRGFPMTMDALDVKARGFQVRGSRGRLIVERAFKIAAAVARIGDVVTIGFDGPDCEGGSLNGRLARVIGRRPSWRDGRVDLKLEVFESVYRLAPSAVIASVSTTSVADDTVTLSTTSPDVSDTSPTSDFHVGQTITRWDVSAGASESLTIASIPNGTQLVFTTGLTLALEANRDWITWGTLGTSSGTTGDGDDEGDWLYFMPASGTAAEGATRRWQ
jgi:hypothetical protein